MVQPTPHQGPTPEDPLLLALRLKQGDESALGTVLQTLGPKVEGGLRKRHPTLRAEDLEDVLSQASHRMWQARAQFDPGKGSLASWFFIIADNLARDLVRRETRQPALVTNLDQLPERLGKSREDDGEEPIVPGKELDEILQKLAFVDHRIISEYARAGGEGPWAAGLAEDLGLSAGAIRVRCHRLKKKIRQEMLALGSLGAFAQVPAR
jgi:RNA polymerase sigma factor (sigma-70 family)